MRFSSSADVGRQAARSAERFLEQAAQLPVLSLSDFQPSATALMVVDMVNGFALKGALSSPRIGQLIDPIAELAGKCEQAGIPVVAFADCHTQESMELESYPPHCLKGTTEAMVCEPIAEACSFTKIDKNSTNGFVEPAFTDWLNRHPAVDTYIVTGDCTDICIQQFVLTLKAWYNTQNRPCTIVLPLALLDTFDGPGHEADVVNVFSLQFMQAAGAQLCADIRL